MSEPVEISVREPEAIVRKRIPSPKTILVPFEYNPSADGVDENLLILLHGLGRSGL